MGLQIKKIATDLDDVFLLKREIFNDQRGSFSKTYNYENLRKLDINFDIKESVYSISKKNVLRGMHFQQNPFAQSKIIHVIEGEILDVIVRVKKNDSLKAPIIYSRKLSKKNKFALCIPGYYAHGYLTLSEHSIVSYLSSSKFNQKSEIVLNYNSFGYKWPNLENLIISDKDKKGIDYKDI
jgi:dTDP-4-dehydrorhamnose 3,5-epimerase